MQLDEASKTGAGRLGTVVVATLVLTGCVAMDCPMGSTRIKNGCVFPDGGHAAHGESDGGKRYDGGMRSDAGMRSNAGTRADGGSRGDGMRDGGSTSPGSDAALDANMTVHDAAPAGDAGPCDGAMSILCFADADRDGFALAAASSEVQCSDRCAVGWTANDPSADGADCDDHDATAYPRLCWKDVDGDTYAPTNAVKAMKCGTTCPTGWTAQEPLSTSIDCDDSDPTRLPGAAEACNGIDDDCDSTVDEGASSTCTLANATATCDQGACKIVACTSGYDSCDQKQANGCEQALNAHDHCGGCATSCDARASCVQGTSAYGCLCDAPLVGDGTTCLGDGTIASGRGFVCGLRQNGTVECFGSAPTGTDAINSKGPFKQLAAGQTHACALKADDTAVCWGTDQNGETQAPAVSQPYVQIAAGGASCGLLKDGSTLCWGTNLGETPPAGEKLRQITVGEYHACGLRADGSAVCWGAGKQAGTCPLGSTHACGQSAPPSDRFVQITAGLAHTCGLKADGRASCWGAGTQGTYNSAVLDFGQAQPIDGQYQFISAGGLHTCALITATHELRCWGSGSVSSPSSAPGYGQAIPPSGGFLRVHSGYDHSCGLNIASQLVCWGNLGGQNPIPATASGSWPAEL